MDSASYSPIMPSQAIHYISNGDGEICVTKPSKQYPTFVPDKMVDILYAIRVCESYILSIKDKTNKSLQLLDSTLSANGIPKLVAEAIQGDLLRIFEESAKMQFNLHKAYNYTNEDCHKEWTMRELKEFFNSIPEKDLDSKIDESFLKLLFSL